MKKQFKIALVFLISISLPILVNSQQFDSGKTQEPDGISSEVMPNRDLSGYGCPDYAIFDQCPNNPQGTYGSNEGDQVIYPWFEGVHEKIGGVVFWGATSNVCPSYDFKIYFHRNNDVSGGIGELVNSFEVNLIPEATGWMFGDGRVIYRFEAVLPTFVSLEEGWLSIQGTDPNCGFSWLRGNDNSKMFLYTNPGMSGYNFFFRDMNFAFNGPTYPMPLSDYAIYFGIFLIIAFTAIRFRRSIF